ncbi:MAG: tungsten formylmethanofuran dehydrogenase [Chitinophagaceae bacterium]|nr:tungsten formylmethanofuran dehydrogenase [Chitinophagaceae bacterium]
MLNTEILVQAYSYMFSAKTMADTFEANRQICKYVHAASRGHEAIQIATGLHLLSCDFVSPYYRDDCLLLSLGFTPYQLMLQLLAKANDPFSGGRSYYCHPNNRGNNKPTIIHQSSATGMQAIPTTGIAQGVQYLERIQSTLLQKGINGEAPVVLCSFGDNSLTEGEVSEAFQFAVLKQLPIIYLVQDNQWGISVSAEEARAMNAFEYAAGFKGMKRMQCDGSDFIASYETMETAISYARKERRPILVHARVPLLAHHTSGVRREFYRTKEDLLKHYLYDPLPKLHQVLVSEGVTNVQILATEKEAENLVLDSFARAVQAPDPAPSIVADHIFAETTVVAETGVRQPEGSEKVMMVDAALHAIEEIMQEHSECIFYGQDVGRRLGGVFREAATLAEKFGDHRVFNTPIQEAYIIGSTVGLSAVGIKPIVEVQFGDYLFPGFNQLVTEVSKSCYLTAGKFPVGMILRIPVGAYGGGGPYHSASIESTLLTIKGIKICFPSNAADMKGLMKAAFLDPNPVIMLEHKGLYWSKVPGTEDAKCVEPSPDYIIPLGKAKVVLYADAQKLKKGETVCIITYGMGVYWAKAAAAAFMGKIEILDLRSLFPLDETLIFETVRRHGKCLIVTEEPINNSFAEALSFRISTECYHALDAPVVTIGALNLPSVPINLALEHAMLPNAQKVQEKISQLLSY